MKFLNNCLKIKFRLKISLNFKYLAYNFFIIIYCELKIRQFFNNLLKIKFRLKKYL